MPKNTEPVELPRQRGRIVVEGKESVLFWVRAFRLEDDVLAVHQELLKEDPKIVASMTISSEYRVSPELIYIYLLCPLVDMVGVCDGSGIIYYASSEFEQETYRIRDEFTEYAIREARDQGKLREVRHKEPGREV
jgi:hypothetical protein